jgi:molybdopterin synthase catalytic subunit
MLMEKRFALTELSIDPAEERRHLSDPRAGGYAAFEGWVRDHDDGRSVVGLDYQAYSELALREGERVIAEAHERFDILRARCVHRHGELAIGDLAVWVGVSAAHRDAAFAACRYVIDQVKDRLPIWKREHYREGTSIWINCQRIGEPMHQGGGTHDQAIAR